VQIFKIFPPKVLVFKRELFSSRVVIILTDFQLINYLLQNNKMKWKQQVVVFVVYIILVLLKKY